jgi:hypothetical protein
MDDPCNGRSSHYVGHPYFIPTTGRHGVDWAPWRAEKSEVSGLNVTRWTNLGEHPDIRRYQPDSAGGDGKETAWIDRLPWDGGWSAPTAGRIDPYSFPLRDCYEP